MGHAIIILNINPWDAGATIDLTLEPLRPKHLAKASAVGGGAGGPPGHLGPASAVQVEVGGFGLMSSGQGPQQALNIPVSPEPPAGHLR